jgi:predicted metal-dependent hydrolase
MPALLVRKLSIDLKQGFAPVWFDGDPYRTQLFNATSMTFPQGEQYFIDCVREALPFVKPGALHEAMQGFIGQEATHRHLHAQYNAVLERQGLRYVLQRWLDWRIRQSRHISLKSRLAVTVAFEHLTALFALLALRGDAGLDKADDVPRLLWAWHSAEELEHKSVAFDAYQAVGGGPALRVAWFVYACVLFTGDITVQTLYNLHRSRQLLNWRTWTGAARYWLGRHGLLWSLVPHMLAYCSPRFHPSRQRDQGLAEQWLQAHRADYQVLGERPQNLPQAVADAP